RRAHPNAGRQRGARPSDRALHPRRPAPADLARAPRRVPALTMAGRKAGSRRTGSRRIGGSARERGPSMSWRRGELWLETDVLWFREGVAAPALAGFSLPALPTFGTGLGASRRRREELRRRRSLRRVRTAALVLSPAVVLPLAASRVVGGHRSALEVE